jgi:hypothetical protein
MLIDEFAGYERDSVLKLPFATRQFGGGACPAQSKREPPPFGRLRQKSANQAKNCNYAPMMIVFRRNPGVV